MKTKNHALALGRI